MIFWNYRLNDNADIFPAAFLSDFLKTVEVASLCIYIGHIQVYFYLIQIEHLDRRQLTFAAFIMAHKLDEDKKDLGLITSLLVVMEHLMSSLSNDLSKNLAESKCMVHILTPYAVKLFAGHNCHNNMCALVVSKLFQSPNFFSILLDKMSLFGNQENVELLWRFAKLVIDNSHAESPGRNMFREAFALMAKGFYKFSPLAMIRFCTIIQKMDDSKPYHVVCFLTSIQCLLHNTESLPKDMQDSGLIHPILDLLTMIPNSDPQTMPFIFACFKSLVKFSGTSDVVNQFVSFLSEYSSELVTSRKNLPTIMAKYFEAHMKQLPSSPTRRKVTRSAKSTPDSTDTSSLMELIFEVLSHENLIVDAPWYVSNCLELLQATDHTKVTPFISPMLMELSKHTKEESAEIDKRLLDNLVHFISPQSAHNLTKNFFDVLAGSNNLIVKKAVVGQISQEFCENLPNEDVQFHLAIRLLDLLHSSIDIHPKLHEIKLSFPLLKRLVNTLICDIEGSSSKSNRKRRVSRTTSVSSTTSHNEDESIGSNKTHDVNKLVAVLECIQLAPLDEVYSNKASCVLDVLFSLLQKSFEESFSSKIDHVNDDEEGTITVADRIRHLSLASARNIVFATEIEENALDKMDVDVIVQCFAEKNLLTLRNALSLVEIVASKHPKILQKSIGTTFKKICSSLANVRNEILETSIAKVTKALVPLITVDSNDFSLGESSSLYSVVKNIGDHWISKDGVSTTCTILLSTIFEYCLEKDGFKSVAMSMAMLICQRLARLDFDNEDDIVYNISRTNELLGSIISEMNQSSTSMLEIAKLTDILIEMATKLTMKDTGSEFVKIAKQFKVDISSKPVVIAYRLNVLAFVNSLLTLLSENTIEVCTILFVFIVDNIKFNELINCSLAPTEFCLVEFYAYTIGRDIISLANICAHK